MTIGISPETAVSLLLIGIVDGMLISLLATGVALIFGVMRLANLAHGGFMILGAFISYSLTTSITHNAYVSIVFSGIFVALFGLATERFGFRKILKGAQFTDLFFSFALLIVMQNAMATIWQNRLTQIPSLFSFPIQTGFVGIDVDWIAAAVSGLLLNIAVYFFLSKTDSGRAARAVRQNPSEAQLMGVNLSRTYAIVFVIGGALAGIAGTFYGIINPFTAYDGAVPTLEAFSVLLIGGLESPIGAIIASLLYGLSQSFGTYIIGGQFSDAIVFTILIGVLLAKPYGLFGRAVRTD